MATDKIALTSSMRSNLLSLKNTQMLLDRTQERLSTGYKVNSAMDNPSSYFTAQSLNARANDLSTLLDSIGQALSTLEVADEGITTLQEFVEQAKSIAANARDSENIASSVVSENVVFNPATAKDDILTDIVANSKSGDQFTIRLGDATTMQGTSNVSIDQTLEEIGIAQGGVIEMIIGDKTYEFTFESSGSGISSPDSSSVAVKQSFGVDTSLEDFMSNVVYTIGRNVLNAEIKDGKMTFNTLDNSSLLIRSTAGFVSNQPEVHPEARKITAVQISAAQGSSNTGSAKLTIDGVELDLGYDTSAVTDVDDVINLVNANAELAAKGIKAVKDGSDIQIYNEKAGVSVGEIEITGATGGTEGTSVDNATIAAATDYELQVQTDFNQILGFDAGYSITVTDGMTVEQFRQAVDGLNGVSADFDSNGHLVISGEQGDDMVIADVGSGNFISSLLGDHIIAVRNGSNEREKYARQFDDILNQIDQLVQDTSYKGINLLNGDDLTVVFNESRTSTLELKGVVFNSVGLGFTVSENEWKDNADIDKSLDQITKATSLLRAQASYFSQKLSTVQIREDFTESMINNLTTGADQLVLADMNEEAANMLALQTRQQLGINSLSLASQASQSVLQLF